MLKRNASIILIILLTILLIALVIWLFDKRIKNIEKKMEPVLSTQLIEATTLICNELEKELLTHHLSNMYKPK